MHKYQSVMKTNEAQLLERNESSIVQEGPHEVSGGNNFVTNQTQDTGIRRSGRARTQNVTLKDYVTA